VDGAFAGDGAGAGMVLCDHQGQVIFTTCGALPTEAELWAIKEGLRLALHWTNLNSALETDCAEAAKLIKESTRNKSAYGFKVNEIGELIWERQVNIAKISPQVNGVSHELAKLDWVYGRTEFWLPDFP
jgi:ribonuclease HI